MPTVYLLKDGGFAVKDANGNSTSEFAGIITLGTLGASDQVYYQQIQDGMAKNVYATGPVNQCIKTYGWSVSNSIGFAPNEPAQVQNNMPAPANETVDLTTSRHLTITIDGEGPTEVNIAGSTPAATTYDEIVAKINAAFTGDPCEKIGTGVNARIRITGTATTNGNFIIVTDGTTTTGTMNLFSNLGQTMIDEAGDHIYTTGGMITTFHPGETIAVTGSTSNNESFLISNIRSDYTRMTTAATDPALTTEAPGQTVTIIADARQYFKIFAREYQKLYAQSEIADIGVTTLTYQAYRFPLANADDLKVTHADGVVGADLPYTDMDITYLPGVGFAPWANATVYPANSVVSNTGRWYFTAAGGTSSGTDPLDDSGVTWTAYAGERQIGANYYPFNIIIDADAAGNGGLPTAEQIYEFIQYSLRQNSDIDTGTGTVIGKTANVLLSFVGDTLVTEPGVYIDDFAETDINRIEFYDYLGNKRVYPFVAAGTINFNDNLVIDGSAIYKMFFTNNDAGSNNGADFGTASAIIVQDNDDVNIAGNITAPSVQFTYDYDGNLQRGAGSAATDVPVTVVAIGLTKAQYVKATGTIGRSNANSFSLVASLERNYSNPA